MRGTWAESRQGRWVAAAFELLRWSWAAALRPLSRRILAGEGEPGSTLVPRSPEQQA